MSRPALLLVGDEPGNESKTPGGDRLEGTPKQRARKPCIVSPYAFIGGEVGVAYQGSYPQAPGVASIGCGLKSGCHGSGFAS